MTGQDYYDHAEAFLIQQVKTTGHIPDYGWCCAVDNEGVMQVVCVENKEEAQQVAASRSSGRANGLMLWSHWFTIEDLCE
jgi:hypothetical protein